MKKIRVLVLSHMYPRAGDPTAGIFIHHQVRHLKREGCEVMVISPLPYVPKFLSQNKRYGRYRQTPLESNLDGVHVIHPRYMRPPGRVFHAPSCYTMFLGIKKSLDKLIHEFHPQLIHAHTATPDGYTGVLLKRRFGLPLVVSLRGSDVNVYPCRDRLTFHLTRKVISEADRVTAVSGALRLAAEKIICPQKEIAVVYAGCDLERFSFSEAARAAFRERLNIPLESPVLIFIGGLLRTKGVFELVDAFLLVRQEHPELHLIIIGSGEEAKALWEKVVEAKVEKRVHLMGARPHNEIPKWLSAADVLVLPSWREGLPNVVVEAMACERAVVATRVGGIPEAVEDGESGILVDKGNVEALVKAIALLLKDEGRRQSMGVIGRQIVENKFTWERNAIRMTKVYEEVLNAS